MKRSLKKITKYINFYIINNYYQIFLSYVNGKPSLKIISRVSKPGRRVYSKLRKLPSYFKGYGVTIVSTSKGIMTDKTARTENLSGEILCQIF